MRTTVVLDDKLVEEAREVLGGTTLRGLLETALREAVGARQRAALIRAMGTIDLDMTEEELHRLRQDRPIVAEWARGESVDEAEPPSPPRRRRRKGARAQVAP